jgi:carotenoid 1,2-hydratase
VSDDGAATVVVIAMLGNPFSPTYARARARARAVDPLDYSAFNVSVTSGRASRWALTERAAGAVARDAQSLGIARSRMRWSESGAALVIDVDERSAPWGCPLRGRIVFHPSARTTEAVPIDGLGDHVWWPVAPLGRVEVELTEPSVRFSGTGYLDANAGSVPLEESFVRWSWSRVSSPASVAVTYDVLTRGSGPIGHAYSVDGGGVRALDVAQEVTLRRSRFGLERTVRTIAGSPPRLLRALADGPFYARSLIETDRGPLVHRGVHEVVDLDRFASSWVQFLIPFRMRREAA